MEINNTSGEVITLEEAKQYTHSFQKLYPNEKKAFFVGKDQLLKILEQPDCLGIRIYNGYNDDEKVSNKVLIGVDSLGNDMEEGVILEKLIPCPPICSGSGGL
jgi:hypothetical protein